MVKAISKIIQVLGYGFVVGAAGLIPGFSSGTMAYAMSVYPFLIGIYAAVLKQPTAWSSWGYAVLLLVSMGLGAYATSFFISYILWQHEVPVMWVFIGFVLGSVLFLRLEIQPSAYVKWFTYSLALAFLLVAFATFVLPLIRTEAVIDSEPRLGLFL